jgi:histidinol-phosphatase (PHP family)
MEDQERNQIERNFKKLLINGDIKSNYHTHTLYCDGKDSPRALAQRAYELGFKALGFSGHEWSPYDEDYAMNPGNFKRYIEDIRQLKSEYEGKMAVYTGIERDYYSEPSSYDFDYVIGSVHHVLYEGDDLPVDMSEESFVKTGESIFGGDYMAFVKLYYDTVKDVLVKTGGSIVGHFDLITKFNRGGKYFDEESTAYRKMAVDTIDSIISSYKADENKPVYKGMPPELAKALRKNLPIFEINTGAIARGYREDPYPAKFILEELVKRNVPILFGSDCHDKDFLNCGGEKLTEIFT